MYVMCVHGSGGTTLLFGSSVQHVSAAAAVVVVHAGFHSHSACSVQRPSSAAVIGSVAHGWLIQFGPLRQQSSPPEAGVVVVVQSGSHVQ